MRLKLRGHHSRRKRLASSEVPPPLGRPFLSLFPFFSSFFFFFFFCFFGHRGWRKGVREEWQSYSIGENCSSFASGKKKREPMAPNFQSKTTSFWVVLLFFFLNQNTLKRLRFGVPVFFFLKKIRIPQNDVVLGFLI